MTPQTVSSEVLRTLPIFVGMTDAERDQIIEISTTMEFSPGEVALRQGKSSQNVLVVLEGRCQVIKQTGANPPCNVTLAELGPSDHFGEMSFFHAAPHSASVHAVTKLKLLRIQRTDYDALVEQNSLAAYKLAYNMLEVMAERLRRMDHWVTDLMCSDTSQKQSSEWNTFRDKLFNSWSL